jgi:hypothetical protein
MPNNNLIAFFQAVTGAGLFGKLRRPGAPTEFIDSRASRSISRAATLKEPSAVTALIYLTDPSSQTTRRIWKTL